MSILSDNDMSEIILVVHNIIADEFERDYDRDLDDDIDPDARQIIISCVESDSFRKKFFIKKQRTGKRRLGFVGGIIDVTEDYYGMFTRKDILLENIQNDSEYIPTIRQRIQELPDKFTIHLIETIISIKDLSRKSQVNGSGIKKFIADKYLGLTFYRKRVLFESVRATPGLFDRVSAFTQFRFIFDALKSVYLDFRTKSTEIDKHGVLTSAASQIVGDELREQILRDIPCPHMQFVIRYFYEDPETYELYARPESGIPAAFSRISGDFLFKVCKLRLDISGLREYVGRENFTASWEKANGYSLFFKKTSKFLQYPTTFILQIKKLDTVEEMTAEDVEAVIILKQVYDRFILRLKDQASEDGAAAAGPQQKKQRTGFYKQYIRTF